jgi:hypothetical protein
MPDVKKAALIQGLDGAAVKHQLSRNHSQSCKVSRLTQKRAPQLPGRAGLRFVKASTEGDRHCVEPTSQAQSALASQDRFALLKAPPRYSSAEHGAARLHGR